MPDLIESTKPVHRFTRDNAREYALKGNAIRWSQERRKAELQANIPQAPEPIADDYHARRIMRVREQLNRIDDMLLREEDPQKIDRLASAQLRLSEQERILAGRPLPGSRKPAPERRQPVAAQQLTPVPVAPELHENKEVSNHEGNKGSTTVV